MVFGFRYWKHLMVLTLKNSWLIILVAALISASFGMPGASESFSVLDFVIRFMFRGALIMVILSVFVLILMLKDFKVMSIFNRTGFSREYLEAYERKHIIGKPFNENTAMVYAEIFVNSGDPVAAMRYLDTLCISENNLFAKTAYFFLYTLAALKSGAPELADRVWAAHQQFINNFMGKPNYAMNSHMLYLTMIYTDCANGRYQRALEQTVGFMNSKEYKLYKLAELDFRIIHLLELKKLGMEEELNRLAPAVKRDIENSRPLYDWQKPRLLEDYNKVINGICPW